MPVPFAAAGTPTIITVSTISQEIFGSGYDAESFNSRNLPVQLHDIGSRWILPCVLVIALFFFQQEKKTCRIEILPFTVFKLVICDSLLRLQDSQVRISFDSWCTIGLAATVLAAKKAFWYPHVGFST